MLTDENRRGQRESGVAYDDELATRLRDLVSVKAGLTEKKMFGGLAMLLNGNLAVGVHRDALLVRVDPEQHGALLPEPAVRPFDMTGRPMTGWLLVDASGPGAARELARWVDRGLTYAATRPPK
jgi:TfoX/Sxy family transcriptional regulator of competence genes